MAHTSYSLELTADDFFPDLFLREPLEFHCMTSSAASFAQFMWQKVGQGFWTERADWSEQQWQERIGLINVAFFVGYSQGEPVGCFELRLIDKEVKIEGFGLIAAYRGEGFGHSMLTHAIEKSLSFGADRIWLETATDDHPAALPLYKSQGFKVFQEQPLTSPMAG